MLEKIFPFLIPSFFTMEKLISFIKFIVKCNWKNFKWRRSITQFYRVCLWGLLWYRYHFYTEPYLISVPVPTFWLVTVLVPHTKSYGSYDSGSTTLVITAPVPGSATLPASQLNVIQWGTGFAALATGAAQILPTQRKLCRTVTIFYGYGSGSDFWKVMVPVLTFEKFRFRL